MRRSINKSWLAVAGVVIASATVYADAPATKWYDAIAIGGYVQGSYVANLSKDTPYQNQLRVYDANNGFNLNQAQLHIAKPVADDSAGFSIKLLTGHDAGLIHSAGLGTESTSFDVEEANLTVNVPKLKNLQFTGGKFVTGCGVEVIDSPSNLTIEPGLLFFYGMPFTHTGGKLAYTLSDKLSVMGGLVNGWDQVVDGNPGKTIIWQIAATPLKALTASFQGSYGPELFNSYPAGAGTSNLPVSGDLNISKRTHTDFVLGYTGIDKLTLNAEYLWGEDTNTGGVADSKTTPWSGAGLWAGYNMGSFLNPGVRFEVFSDQNGANRLGSGVNQTAKDLTLVNKFTLTQNSFMRLEYRHDWSNRAVYSRTNGGGGPGDSVTNQNTISADWVVTF